MTRCSDTLVMKIKVRMGCNYVPIKISKINIENQHVLWSGKLIPGRPTEIKALEVYGATCSIDCSGNEGNKVNDWGGGQLINYGTITVHWYTDKQNGADATCGLEGPSTKHYWVREAKWGVWEGPSEWETHKASALGFQSVGQLCFSWIIFEQRCSQSRVLIESVMAKKYHDWSL